MNLMKKPLLAAMLGVSALGLSVAAPSETQATSSVPIDVWALRDVVSTVQVSPDGEHLLVHINPSREGDYLLQIYRTSDLSEPVRTLAGDRMELISAQWASNNVIYAITRHIITTLKATSSANLTATLSSSICCQTNRTQCLSPLQMRTANLVLIRFRPSVRGRSTNLTCALAHAAW